MSEEIVGLVARAILTEQLRREDDSCKPHGWDDAHDNDHAEAIALARAAIAAHEAALSAAGLVIVPQEPTEATINAGADLIWARICNDQTGCNAHALLMWRAMLAASARASHRH